MGKVPIKHVNVKYQRTSDYKTISASGAVGGITPQGEIMCNFFVEYKELPESIKIELNPDDGSAKQIEEVEKDYFLREVKIGILMRPDIAKVIGKWLVKQSETVLLIKPEPN